MCGDILSGQVLCGEPLSTEYPMRLRWKKEGIIYIANTLCQAVQGDYRIAGLEDYSEGKIESKTIVYYAINYRTYTSRSR